LYYSQDPQALLLKFSRLLRTDGVIIVSIFQKRDSWRARLRLSMTNSRCTRIVKAVIAREQWTIEQNQMIGQHNIEPWWLLAARP